MNALIAYLLPPSVTYFRPNPGQPSPSYRSCSKASFVVHDLNKSTQLHQALIGHAHSPTRQRHDLKTDRRHCGELRHLIRS